MLISKQLTFYPPKSDENRSKLVNITLSNKSRKIFYRIVCYLDNSELYLMVVPSPEPLFSFRLANSIFNHGANYFYNNYKRAIN